MTVELAPITDGNLASVFDLAVRPDQQHFVAPNPWSPWVTSGASPDHPRPRDRTVDKRLVVR